MWIPAYAGMTVRDADMTGRDRRNSNRFCKGVRTGHSHCRLYAESQPRYDRLN